MKLKNILVSLLAVLAIFIAQPAYAMCPICTAGALAGVGLSRWLGIDDTVTGLWIGAVIVSLIYWTLSWLRKRKISFRAMGIIVFAAYYLIIALPLYWKDIIGHPFNKLWGVDKLLLGIIVGSVFFYLFYLIHLALKKKNKGKSYFPFQKVVLPLSPLIILSVIFYWFTRQSHG